MRKKISFLVIVFVLIAFVGVSFAVDGRSLTVYNTTLTVADTVYTLNIGPNTKKFTVQCRTNYDIKLAYTTGGSYITVKKSGVYWEDNLNIISDTFNIYLSSSTAGVVVETVVWR